MIKTVIFIDGNNLYFMLKNKFLIDLVKLRDTLVENDYLLRVYYYTAVDASNEGFIRFLDFLSLNGFTVKTKPIKIYDDGSDSGHGVTIKGNMDSELIVDAMLIANTGKVDKVIIVSGDGDYERMTEVLQTVYGIIVNVAATRDMCSSSLMRRADKFVDLETLRDKIFRGSDGES